MSNFTWFKDYLGNKLVPYTNLEAVIDNTGTTEKSLRDIITEVNERIDNINKDNIPNYSQLAGLPTFDGIKFLGDMTHKQLGFSTVSKTGNYTDLDNLPTIPINISQLNNDKNFIVNTVNNLTNYYLKTDSYSKEEVNNLISNIVTLNVLLVQTLPTDNISQTTIYLVPKPDGKDNDIHNEYINSDGTVDGWELIGNTSIDLSNYYTKAEIDNLLNNKVDKEDGMGLSSTNFTQTEKDKLLNIADGANKTIVDVTLSSTSTNPVQNKAINSALISKANSSDIPTKVSQLTNDSGYITSADIETGVTGVKGENETEFRTGNVNITKENIGVPPLTNNLLATISGNALDATQGKLLDDKIGSLNSLTTEAKDNLAGAINEVDAVCNGLYSKFSNYLPITGGVLTTSVSHQLTLKRAEAGNTVGLNFVSGTTSKGLVGFAPGGEFFVGPNILTKNLLTITQSGEITVLGEKLLKESDGIKVIPISPNSSMNDYYKAGFYDCAFNNSNGILSDRPTNEQFSMIVGEFHSTSNGAYQLVIENKTLPKMFFRIISDTIKGDWCRIYTTADKPTAVYEEIILNGTLTFADKICKINNGKIFSSTLADVYFTADTIDIATEADITVDTYTGYLTLTAQNVPTGTIKATIVIKGVN